MSIEILPEVRGELLDIYIVEEWVPSDEYTTVPWPEGVSPPGGVYLVSSESVEASDTWAATSWPLYAMMSDVMGVVASLDMTWSSENWGTIASSLGPL